MSSKYHNQIFEYEGKTYSYQSAHYWIKSRFGRANHCDNPDCLGKSTKFQWSNKSHEYKLDRSDWQQLCISCHSAFDMTEKSREASRSRLKDNINMRVAVKQIKDGIVIGIFNSVLEASEATGIHRTRISRTLNSVTHYSVGGFEWEKFNKEVQNV